MAHLLIIDFPGGNDTDIAQAALDAGHAFTFLTSQLDLYRRQPAVAAVLSAARELLEVPGFEYPEVERAVRELHQRQPVDAVLCLIDIRLTEAARLARRLGLHYLNPSSATLLRDKFNVRWRLAEQGLAQPEFTLACSNAELKEAVGQLGLPVLIKPADGYGSQNIITLTEPWHLESWVSPLERLLPSGADYGLGVRANDRLLVERFMRGQLIGCDTLTIAGRHQLLGINEKRMFAPPSFAIQGGCFQPYGAEFAAIRDYVFAALDAVGFDCGAAHTEIMLTSEGPRLVEINPRLVGARIPRLMSYALGRPVHQDLIDLHLGRDLRGAPQQQERRVAVTRWIVASQTGILDAIVLPSWRDARIRDVALFKQPGDWVRQPFENADRLGYVMVACASRAEAEQLAERFVADARVVLRAVTPPPPQAPQALAPSVSQTSNALAAIAK